MSRARGPSVSASTNWGDISSGEGFGECTSLESASGQERNYSANGGSNSEAGLQGSIWEFVL